MSEAVPGIESPLAQFSRENVALIRKMRKENRELLAAFGELARFEPFQRYVVVLNAMIQARADELMAPLTNMDAALRQEHIKGTMYGLILARDTVSLTIASAHDSGDSATED